LFVPTLRYATPSPHPAFRVDPLLRCPKRGLLLGLLSTGRVGDFLAFLPALGLGTPNDRHSQTCIPGTPSPGIHESPGGGGGGRGRAGALSRGDRPARSTICSDLDGRVGGQASRRNVVPCSTGVVLARRPEPSASRPPPICCTGTKNPTEAGRQEETTVGVGLGRWGRNAFGKRVAPTEDHPRTQTQLQTDRRPPRWSAMPDQPASATGDPSPPLR